MAYITDAALLASVAARLGSTSATITADSPHEVVIVGECNTEAYNEVRARLIARGYTAAQVDAWDRAAEFNRRVGVCFALRALAIFRETDLKALEMICTCLDDLDTVTLTEDDEPIEPASDSGGISSGALSNDLDVFVEDEDGDGLADS